VSSIFFLVVLKPVLVMVIEIAPTFKQGRFM
jgi:hypothetical protein